jgi:hypothetical protein
MWSQQWFPMEASSHNTLMFSSCLCLYTVECIMTVARDIWPSHGILHLFLLLLKVIKYLNAICFCHSFCVSVLSFPVHCLWTFVVPSVLLWCTVFCMKKGMCTVHLHNIWRMVMLRVKGGGLVRDGSPQGHRKLNII